ncbi:TraR/DksA family transcriptional regulator [Nannocystaceae bacterium ST9]
MDRRTLQLLRANLESQRAELIAEGDLAIPPARSDATAKVDDDEAPLTEMQQSIASNRNRERSERLRRIAEALQRMNEDPDEFGSCEECEEPIPQRRLELMPWATLCAECQERRERDQLPGSRRKITDYV